MWCDTLPIISHLCTSTGWNLPFDPRHHKPRVVFTLPNRKWVSACICQAGPSKRVSGQDTGRAKLTCFNCVSHFHTSFLLSSLPLRGLTDIAAISNYNHIRFLDLSKNNITNLTPLASLTQLLWLKARRDLLFITLKDIFGAVSNIRFNWWYILNVTCLLQVDNNAVTCFKGQPFAQLTYLQWLSLAANQLTDVDGLVGPALERLNLTGWSVGLMIDKVE